MDKTTQYEPSDKLSNQERIKQIIENDPWFENENYYPSMYQSSDKYSGCYLIGAIIFFMIFALMLLMIHFCNLIL